MGFVHDWKKVLGYKSDPFVQWPRKRAQEFIVNRDRERERLNLFIIKNERFGILHGSRGAGKSLLLRWLAEEVRQKVFFIDAEQAQHFTNTLFEIVVPVVERRVRQVREKLSPDVRRSLLIERLRKRRFLLLIDNAQHLTKEGKALLQELFTACPEGQFLFVLERLVKEYESWPFLLELGEMSVASLKELIAKRIALAGGVGTHPFSEKELEQLITKAKKNPAKLLTLARERAIELSLTAGPPPKPASKAPEKASRPVAVKSRPEEHGAKEKRKRWFSIKIVNDWDGEGDEETLDEGLLEPHAAQPEIRPDAQQDAELLKEIIEHATKESGTQGSPVKESALQAPARESAESDVEEVIKTLVHELEEEKHD